MREDALPGTPDAPRARRRRGRVSSQALLPRPARLQGGQGHRLLLRGRGGPREPRRREGFSAQRTVLDVAGKRYLARPRPRGRARRAPATAATLPGPGLDRLTLASILGDSVPAAPLYLGAPAAFFLADLDGDGRRPSSTARPAATSRRASSRPRGRAQHTFAILDGAEAPAIAGANDSVCPTLKPGDFSASLPRLRKEPRGDGHRPQRRRAPKGPQGPFAALVAKLPKLVKDYEALEALHRVRRRRREARGRAPREAQAKGVALAQARGHDDPSRPSPNRRRPGPRASARPGDRRPRPAAHLAQDAGAVPPAPGRGQPPPPPRARSSPRDGFHERVSFTATWKATPWTAPPRA